MPSPLVPFGSGPFGFAPVAAPSPPGVRQEGTPLLHPGTHDALVLADGTLASAHPVDQQVYLALGLSLGTVGSASSVGSRLGAIEHRGQDFPARVRIAVEEALRQLIARGDIALLGVTTTLIEGGFVAHVTYQNLRLTPSEPQTVPVPLS